MKLKSFRIRNYRSISDSGICNLSSDNVTILAGMNESGKTSILEALEDFDTSREIREKAIPINRKDLKPEIAINFEVEKEVLEELKKEINIQTDTKSSIDIEIIKRYPNNYSISPEEIQKFGIRNEQKAEIIQNKSQKNSVQIIEELKKKIPKFILFSSFDDKFPSEINLHNRGGYSYDYYSSNNKNDDFIKDLAIVSDLDIDIITSGSPSEKVKHKRKLNIKMNNDYKLYWTQDFSKLCIDWDSDKINFFIEENEEFFFAGSTEQRKAMALGVLCKSFS
jgi:predicted ATP-dependent endonuclease of OLD family